MRLFLVFANVPYWCLVFTSENAISFHFTFTLFRFHVSAFILRVLVLQELNAQTPKDVIIA
jgi:hypothetical protein